MLMVTMQRSATAHFETMVWKNQHSVDGKKSDVRYIRYQHDVVDDDDAAVRGADVDGDDATERDSAF